MKALLVLGATLGAAAFVVVRLRRRVPTPPQPIGSWEPADPDPG